MGLIFSFMFDKNICIQSDSNYYFCTTMVLNLSQQSIKQTQSVQPSFVPLLRGLSKILSTCVGSPYTQKVKPRVLLIFFSLPGADKRNLVK